MSIVIAVATDNRIILKTDGREFSVHDRSIVSENCPKSVKLSDKIMIGYTGNKQICEALIEDIKEKYNTNKLQNADDVINYMENNFELIKLSYLSCQFILCYIDQGQPYIVSWNSEENFIRDVKGANSYSILGTKIIQEIPFDYNPELSAESNMNNHIRKIAILDNSVNTNIVTTKIFI